MLKKNTSKPIFISRVSWVKIRMFFTNFKKHKYIRFFQYDRNSTITKNLINKELKIRVGNGWRRLHITKWMVGFKLGAFTWTRRFWKKKEKKKKDTKKKKK
jgi:ribosomal protein S19